MGVWAPEKWLVVCAAVVLAVLAFRWRPGMTETFGEPEVEAAQAGGRAAPAGRYPYVCRLKYSPPDRKKGSFASGFLIQPDVIVTSAHVLWDTATSTRRPLKYFSVFLGSNARGQGEKRAFKEVLNFGSPAFGAEKDYVAVRLNAPSTVQPVRVDGYTANATFGVNTIVWGAGWGRMNVEGNVDGVPADVLQENQLRVTAKTSTTVSVKGDFAADGFAMDRHPCSGDSGSPIILKGATPAEDIAIGIVSRRAEKGMPEQCILDPTVSVLATRTLVLGPVGAVVQELRDNQCMFFPRLDGQCQAGRYDANPDAPDEADPSLGEFTSTCTGDLKCALLANKLYRTMGRYPAPVRPMRPLTLPATAKPMMGVPAFVRATARPTQQPSARVGSAGQRGR